MDTLVNQGSIMFSDPILAFTNIVLLTGIFLAVIAAPKIKKGNRELHAQNLAARRRMHKTH